jgi:superfamily II DNA helicase RecQ
MPLNTKKNLVALVVDEAHCVETRGEKFRTTFGKIGDLGAKYHRMCNCYSHNRNIRTILRSILPKDV